MHSPIPSTLVLSTPHAAALVTEEIGVVSSPEVRIVLSETGYCVRSGGDVMLLVEPADEAQMKILRGVGSARLFERRSDGSFLCLENVSVSQGGRDEV